MCDFHHPGLCPPSRKPDSFQLLKRILCHSFESAYPSPYRRRDEFADHHYAEDGHEQQAPYHCVHRSRGNQDETADHPCWYVEGHVAGCQKGYGKCDDKGFRRRCNSTRSRFGFVRGTPSAFGKLKTHCRLWINILMFSHRRKTKRFRLAKCGRFM